MKKIMIPFAIALTIMAVMLAGMGIFYGKMRRELDYQNGNMQDYERHYMMISGDDSDLWQSVYESASKNAADQDIYLEWLGNDMMVSYTTTECMEIAVASEVDGIILYSDGSEELAELIEEAALQGIPVVTVLNDIPESKRISYVGVNDYQTGEIYGTWVLDALKPGMNRVMVLIDEASSQVNKNLVYSQMYRVVESGKKEGQEVEISTYGIDNSTSFEVEEVIRDIFLNSETIPDILICMDSVSTECAYQALIDYNEVGNMEIVGYYTTDTILDAVNKGLIPVTVAIDADEIGLYSVEALNEYLQYGHVSNYFNVKLELVTEENVGEYIRRREE